jgi:ATP-dependent HslUV protease subunit HslV
LYKLAAALALLDQPNIEADEIVMKAMKIASDICVYTNYNLTIEKIEPKPVATENKPSSTDSNK